MPNRLRGRKFLSGGTWLNKSHFPPYPPQHRGLGQHVATQWHRIADNGHRNHHHLRLRLLLHRHLHDDGGHPHPHPAREDREAGGGEGEDGSPSREGVGRTQPPRWCGGGTQEGAGERGRGAAALRVAPEVVQVRS
jgi:hypothetical protein